jgi:hypothetical protein
MYFSHAPSCAVHAARVASAGFVRGFEGSQDYDFALRPPDTRRIVHVPPCSTTGALYTGLATASSGEAKPGSFDAGARAIDEALARRGSSGRAVLPPWAIGSKLGLYWHDFSDDGPRVAILVSARNDVAALKRCLDSLAQTTYRNLEIVVVDSEDSDAYGAKHSPGSNTVCCASAPRVRLSRSRASITPPRVSSTPTICSFSVATPRRAIPPGCRG